MDNRTEILDLRTALQVLRGEEGQLIETDVPVDTMAELSGVYRYVGAGGTVKRPTGVNGPAMVFHNLKGFPEASAVIGILGSRKRTGLLLGCPPESLGQLLCECAQNPIPPVVSREKHPVRKWCITLMRKALTCADCFPHRPTHLWMPAHISLWACAMPATRIRG